MTRINVGIKPKELSDRHLLAEHRELKRIPNVLRKRGFKVKLEDIPLLFKLGEGHVKFFYDKLKYLDKRYHDIWRECVKRKFDVTYYGECFVDIPEALYRDYRETNIDRNILLSRLKEKDTVFYKNVN